MNDTVFDQIMAVRSSGVCNMLDTSAVQRYAYEHNLFELVVFLEEHKKDYINFVFHGNREDVASE